MNKYGFNKSETLTNLISKHGLTRTGNKLVNSDGVITLDCGKVGNSKRIKMMWEYFKNIEV